MSSSFLSNNANINKGDKNKGKFQTLNINNLFKGKGIDAQRSGKSYGFQSLGKVTNSKKMPPPAILPSLRAENQGNDPSINLISSGTSWAIKEKSENDTINTTAENELKSISDPNTSTIVTTKTWNTVVTYSQDLNIKSVALTSIPYGPSKYSSTFQKEFPPLSSESKGPGSPSLISVSASVSNEISLTTNSSKISDNGLKETLDNNTSNPNNNGDPGHMVANYLRPQTNWNMASRKNGIDGINKNEDRHFWPPLEYSTSSSIPLDSTLAKSDIALNHAATDLGDNGKSQGKVYGLIDGGGINRSSFIKQSYDATRAGPSPYPPYGGYYLPHPSYYPQNGYPYYQPSNPYYNSSYPEQHHKVPYYGVPDMTNRLPKEPFDNGPEYIDRNYGKAHYETTQHGHKKFPFHTSNHPQYSYNDSMDRNLPKNGGIRGMKGYNYEDDYYYNSHYANRSTQRQFDQNSYTKNSYSSKYAEDDSFVNYESGNRNEGWDNQNHQPPMDYRNEYSSPPMQKLPRSRNEHPVPLLSLTLVPEKSRDGFDCEMRASSAAISDDGKYKHSTRDTKSGHGMSYPYNHIKSSVRPASHDHTINMGKNDNSLYNKDTLQHCHASPQDRSKFWDDGSRNIRTRLKDTPPTSPYLPPGLPVDRESQDEDMWNTLRAKQDQEISEALERARIRKGDVPRKEERDPPVNYYPSRIKDTSVASMNNYVEESFGTVVSPSKDRRINPPFANNQPRNIQQSHELYPNKNRVPNMASKDYGGGSNTHLRVHTDNQTRTSDRPDRSRINSGKSGSDSDPKAQNWVHDKSPRNSTGGESGAAACWPDKKSQRYSEESSGHEKDSATMHRNQFGNAMRDRSRADHKAVAPGHKDRVQENFNERQQRFQSSDNNRRPQQAFGEYHVGDRNRTHPDDKKGRDARERIDKEEPFGQKHHHNVNHRTQVKDIPDGIYKHNNPSSKIDVHLPTTKDVAKTDLGANSARAKDNRSPGEDSGHGTGGTKFKWVFEDGKIIKLPIGSEKSALTSNETSAIKSRENRYEEGGGGPKQGIIGHKPDQTTKPSKSVFPEIATKYPKSLGRNEVSKPRPEAAVSTSSRPVSSQPIEQRNGAGSTHSCGHGSGNYVDKAGEVKPHYNNTNSKSGNSGGGSKRTGPAEQIPPTKAPHFSSNAPVPQSRYGSHPEGPTRTNRGARDLGHIYSDRRPNSNYGPQADDSFPRPKSRPKTTDAPGARVVNHKNVGDSALRNIPSLDDHIHSSSQRKAPGAPLTNAASYALNLKAGTRNPSGGIGGASNNPDDYRAKGDSGGNSGVPSPPRHSVLRSPSGWDETEEWETASESSERCNASPTNGLGAGSRSNNYSNWGVATAKNVGEDRSSPGGRSEARKKVGIEQSIGGGQKQASASEETCAPKAFVSTNNNSAILNNATSKGASSKYQQHQSGPLKPSHNSSKYVEGSYGSAANRGKGFSSGGFNHEVGRIANAGFGRGSKISTRPSAGTSMIGSRGPISRYDINDISSVVVVDDQPDTHNAWRNRNNSSGGGGGSLSTAYTHNDGDFQEVLNRKAMRNRNKVTTTANGNGNTISPPPPLGPKKSEPPTDRQRPVLEASVKTTASTAENGCEDRGLVDTMSQIGTWDDSSHGSKMDPSKDEVRPGKNKEDTDRFISKFEDVDSHDTIGEQQDIKSATRASPQQDNVIDNNPLASSNSIVINPVFSSSGMTRVNDDTVTKVLPARSPAGVTHAPSNGRSTTPHLQRHAHTHHQSPTPISPSAADLNQRIASVKKVWDVENTKTATHLSSRSGGANGTLDSKGTEGNDRMSLKGDADHTWGSSNTEDYAITNMMTKATVYKAMGGSNIPHSLPPRTSPSQIVKASLNQGTPVGGGASNVCKVKPHKQQVSTLPVSMAGPINNTDHNLQQQQHGEIQHQQQMTFTANNSNQTLQGLDVAPTTPSLLYAPQLGPLDQGSPQQLYQQTSFLRPSNTNNAMAGLYENFLGSTGGRPAHQQQPQTLMDSSLQFNTADISGQELLHLSLQNNNNCTNMFLGHGNNSANTNNNNASLDLGNNGGLLGFRPSINPLNPNTTPSYHGNVYANTAPSYLGLGAIPLYQQNSTTASPALGGLAPTNPLHSSSNTTNGNKTGAAPFQNQQPQHQTQPGQTALSRAFMQTAANAPMLLQLDPLNNLIDMAALAQQFQASAGTGNRPLPSQVGSPYQQNACCAPSHQTATGVQSTNLLYNYFPPPPTARNLGATGLTAPPLPPPSNNPHSALVNNAFMVAAANQQHAQQHTAHNGGLGTLNVADYTAAYMNQQQQQHQQENLAAAIIGNSGHQHTLAALQSIYSNDRLQLLANSDLNNAAAAALVLSTPSAIMKGGNNNSNTFMNVGGPIGTVQQHAISGGPSVAPGAIVNTSPTPQESLLFNMIVSNINHNNNTSNNNISGSSYGMNANGNNVYMGLQQQHAQHHPDQLLKGPGDRMTNVTGSFAMLSMSDYFLSGSSSKTPSQYPLQYPTNLNMNNNNSRVGSTVMGSANSNSSAAARKFGPLHNKQQPSDVIASQSASLPNFMRATPERVLPIHHQETTAVGVPAKDSGNDTGNNNVKYETWNTRQASTFETKVDKENTNTNVDKISSVRGTTGMTSSLGRPEDKFDNITLAATPPPVLGLGKGSRHTRDDIGIGEGSSRKKAIPSRLNTATTAECDYSQLQSALVDSLLANAEPAKLGAGGKVKTLAEKSVKIEPGVVDKVMVSASPPYISTEHQATEDKSHDAMAPN